MSPFGETLACQSRTHCATCRDRDGGRAWRESLASVFMLPGDVIDFVCPHGVPWGGVWINGPGDMLANWIARIVQPFRCRRRACPLHRRDCGCAGRRAWLNALGRRYATR